MKKKEIDVLIIGAGSAGLSAMKELRRYTKNFLVVDRGPLGTTCSRVGCMPSKIFLQMAEDYHRLKTLAQSGVWKGETAGKNLLDTSRLMNLLREKRDHFVSYTLEEIDALQDQFMQGEAQFIGPNTVRIDDNLEITAKKIIIAAGTKPNVPKEWEPLRDRILTTDEFFEMKDIAARWAVIGLGPLGLELGQGLSWLDREVHGFDKNDTVGALKDPIVKSQGIEIFRKSFPIELGVDVEISSSPDNKGLIIEHGSRRITVDRVLASIGRKPNFESLKLKESGCEWDEQKNAPIFDINSMAVKGAPLYIAGDIAGDRPVLHEAVDEGRIAAFNAAHGSQKKFKRRVPLTIAFTTPNIFQVGKKLEDISSPLIGEVSFDNQGRAVILNENQGHLRIYAEAQSGKILGAECLMPSGEHIAHLLAMAIQHEATVASLLSAPFYHPTVEEGLRTALQDLKKKMKAKAKAKKDESGRGETENPTPLDLVEMS